LIADYFRSLLIADAAALCPFRRLLIIIIFTPCFRHSRLSDYAYFLSLISPRYAFDALSPLSMPSLASVPPYAFSSYC